MKTNLSLFLLGLISFTSSYSQNSNFVSYDSSFFKVNSSDSTFYQYRIYLDTIKGITNTTKDEIYLTKELLSDGVLRTRFRYSPDEKTLRIKEEMSNKSKIVTKYYETGLPKLQISVLDDSIVIRIHWFENGNIEYFEIKFERNTLQKHITEAVC